jgi:hypothetical protein
VETREIDIKLDRWKIVIEKWNYPSVMGTVGDWWINII